MGMIHATNPISHRQNGAMKEQEYNGGCNNSLGNGKSPPDYLPGCSSEVLGNAAMHIPAVQGGSGDGKSCDNFKGNISHHWRLSKRG